MKNMVNDEIGCELQTFVNTMSLTLMLLSATLQPGDVTGFTFFIGLMAMFAASVFFLF
jgi:hypothetical protein